MYTNSFTEKTFSFVLEKNMNFQQLKIKQAENKKNTTFKHIEREITKCPIKKYVRQNYDTVRHIVRTARKTI